MATTMVRVTARTHSTLRAMASASGRPMREVLDEAVQRYWADHFWDSVDAAYRRLREDAPDWQADRDERVVLDGSLGDGLGT